MRFPQRAGGFQHLLEQRLGLIKAVKCDGRPGFLELFVDQAHLVDAQDPGKICEENVKAMVFNMNDVIRCSAIDTDLDYAIKGWPLFTQACPSP